MKKFIFIILCFAAIAYSAEKRVVVSGDFDDIKSRDIRFLEEASKLGSLSVVLWSDEKAQEMNGKRPKFPLEERLYLLEGIRYVDEVVADDGDMLPEDLEVDVWAEKPKTANEARKTFAEERQIAYRVFKEEELDGFPAPPPNPSIDGEKKVVVTGCYDWFHSGHVRFFEEAANHGDLYVILGHDANIRLLKGEGHPLYPEDERRYIVGSFKYVKEALLASGSGWLDADPEIQKLKPDFYIVNEDGDKGGKREYCEKNGIEYKVLQRLPAPGLPTRSSTDLKAATNPALKRVTQIGASEAKQN